jgi:uncharacterized protein (TIGR02265 family)
VQVKGVAIRSLLAAIEVAFGAPALGRVTGALSEEVRAQLEPVVLASSFYPIAVSAAIHEAIRYSLGGGSVNANRRVGAEAARRDFSGIYRVFIRVADYNRLLEGIERAWRQYNSHGSVEWQRIGGHEARCAIREVEGFTEAMWHSIAGRFETMLLLSGAKHATVAVDDWSAHNVTLHARWTP